LILRSYARLCFVSLAAAISAAAAGIVGYVLLLSSFLKRTPSTIIEPRWLLPSTLCIALVLSSFVAQRFLARGYDRDRQLTLSIALGSLVGVLMNVGWAVRLLMTNVSIADLAHAWSLLPLAASLAGSLLGHLRMR
jgi:hypothetical protein